MSNTLCRVFAKVTKTSYVYWLMFGKVEKLFLVILSLAAFVVVSAAFLDGSIYRWNTPVLSSSICSALSSLQGHLDVVSEMIPQKLYLVRLSTFFTLLMTWNKLWHGQFFLLVIIIIYYVYPRTDYCCSTLFAYYFYYIFFDTRAEDSHPYSTNSLILSALTRIIFLYELIYSQWW